MGACGNRDAKQTKEAPKRRSETSVYPAFRPSGAPSLLLVTIDTWRWDYVGASGSGKVATPALDRLAREGAYEPECETPCPLTTPAHATIMTGLWPIHHRVLDCISYTLPQSLHTLAEAFQADGYATAAFVSSLSLDRRFKLDRGFSAYDEGAMAFGGGESSRDGNSTTESAMAFISGRKPDEPLFLWAHYYDLHLPYRPRPDFDPRYPGNPYAAETAFVDGQIARLVSYLANDKGRNWRIIVVGDHGEGLGDHHEMGHGMALYRSTLHVPLILWPKPERPLAHPRPWRLEDIDPTVRDWFGLSAAGPMDGEDLFSSGRADRPLPSFTIQPSVQFAVNPCLGLREGRWMYMRHGVEELYDLSADPGETEDLSDNPKEKDPLAGMRSRCSAMLALSAIQRAAENPSSPSPKELQGLQGLGYIGIPVSNMAALQRADIRIVCDHEAAIERAKREYARTHSPQPMRDAYEALLRKYPRAVGYMKDYGELLINLRDIGRALEVYSRTVQLNPDDLESLANLGGLYLAKGRPEKAKEVFELVLSKNDADPVAHKNLGIIYANFLNDPAKAVAHYKRYLELGPDSDANMVRQYISRVENGGH